MQPRIRLSAIGSFRVQTPLLTSFLPAPNDPSHLMVLSIASIIICGVGGMLS